ncbi:MAG: gamma-butyrobetaine hydroxylase-like domain-containing protein [Leptospirillia bacterium]
MSTDYPQPVEIRRENRDRIVITWSDGHVSDFTNHGLRAGCQCASCVDEWSREPLLDPSTIPADIYADDIQVVGTYAIQPSWSDGHTTGIYSFTLLRSLCPCDVCTATSPQHPTEQAAS